uniref:Titin-like n=1 Tax=Saccoglossus kowalevskii TaxID=10224 RepID=A0ABM0MSM6_SACKO|nr:PREDICTED: titin-like [Saccoglossus kowalevskii]
MKMKPAKAEFEVSIDQQQMEEVSFEFKKDVKEPQVTSAEVEFDRPSEEVSFELELTPEEKPKPTLVEADLIEAPVGDEEEVIDIDLEDKDVEKAAVQIQAAFRGFQARKEAIEIEKALEPPVFVRKIEEQEVEERRRVIFKCEVTGSPRPEVTWYLDGVQIDEDDHYVVEYSESGICTLKIVEVSMDDEGEFEVKAVNKVGSETCRAELFVLPAKCPPTFVIKPEDKEAVKAYPAEIRCKVHGIPTPTVSWFKGWKHCQEGNEYTVTFDKDTNEHIFIIKESKPKDGGKYVCKATNDLGEEKASFTVTLIEKPPTPEPVQEPEPVEEVLELVEEVMKVEIARPVEEEPVIQEEITLEDEVPVEEPVSEEKVDFEVEMKPARAEFEVSIDQQQMEEVSFEIKKDIEEPQVTSAEVEFVRPSEEVSFELELTPDEKPKPVVVEAELKVEPVSEEKVEIEMKMKPAKAEFEVSIDQQSLEEVSFEIKKDVKEPQVTSAEVEFERPSEAVSFELELTPEEKPKPTLAEADLIEAPVGDEEEVIDIDLEDKDVEKAAVQIQAAFRGFQARKEAIEIEKALEPPVFVRKIEEQEVEERQRVVFECEVTGSPRPEVTWYLDGVQIDEDDHYVVEYSESGICTLKIVEVSMDDEGEFEVKAVNKVGSDVCRAELFVLPAKCPPKFVIKPEDKEAVKAYPAEIRCKVHGIPTPTVSWFKGWKHCQEGNEYTVTFDKDTNEHIFIIKESKPKDAGKYVCKATNDLGEEKSSFTVTLIEKPPTPEPVPEPEPVEEVCEIDEEIMPVEITKPVEEEPVIQEEVRLEVEVPVEEPVSEEKVEVEVEMKPARAEFEVSIEQQQMEEVSFEIKKDIEEPQVTSAEVEFVRPSEEVSFQLELTPEEKPKPYVVDAELKVEPVSEEKVEVEMQVKPARAEFDVSIDQHQMEEVSFEIKKDVGEPQVTSAEVAFDRPSEEVSFELELTPEEKPKPTLVEADLIEAPVGDEEEVIDIDLEDKDVEKAAVQIQAAFRGFQARKEAIEIEKALEPPVFVRKIDEQEVEERQRVVFKCEVTGSPRPEVTWYLDGVQIDEDDHYVVEYSESGICTLKIVEVSMDDEGEFEVKAVNKVGSETCRAELFVLPAKCPPTFVIKPEDKEAVKAYPAEIRCKVHGIPTPTVSWFKGWKHCQEGNEYTVTFDKDTNEHIFIIKESKPKDGGKYVCKATNDLGEERASFTVTLIEKPTTPEPVQGPEPVEEIMPVEITKPVEEEPVIQEEVRLEVEVPVEEPVREEKVEVEVEMKPAKAEFELSIEQQQMEEVSFEIKKSVEEPQVTSAEVDFERPSEEVSFQLELTPEEKPKPAVVDAELKVEPVSEEKVEIEMKMKPARAEFDVSIDQQQMEEVSFEIKKDEVSFKLELTPEEKPKPTLVEADLIEAPVGDEEEVIDIDLEDKDVEKAAVQIQAAFRGFQARKEAIEIEKALEPPVFVRKIEEQEVEERQRVVFECEVTGSPRPEVTWYLDGVQIDENDHYVVEYSESGICTLKIVEVSMDDEGEFEVKAVNKVGSETCRAELFVLPAKCPPTFVIKPEDKEAVKTYPAEIRCKVHGIPTPTVSWFKGWKHCQEGNEYTVTFDKDTNEHIFIIKESKPKDGGKYVCKATNDLGEEKASFTVTLIEKPTTPEPVPEPEPIVEEVVEFVEEEAPIEAAVPVMEEVMKEEVTVETEIAVEDETPVAEALPALDEVVKEEVTVKTEMAVEAPVDEQLEVTLKVQPVKVEVDVPEEEVEFTLKKEIEEEKPEDKFDTVDFAVEIPAEEMKPEVEEEVKPVVEEKVEEVLDLTPPVFVKELVPITVEEGCQLHLDVEVKGEPLPTMTWYQDDVEVAADDHLRIGCPKEMESTLDIEHTTAEDEAEYMCKAVNPAGEAVTRAEVIIEPAKEAPVFTKELQTITVTEGKMVHFECQVIGRPHPEVKWYLEGVEIEERENVRIEYSDSGVCVLVIKIASVGDANMYTCKATNVVGEAITKAQLIVEVALRPPMFIVKPNDISAPEGVPAEMRCRVTGNPDPTIGWFKGWKHCQQGAEYNVSYDDEKDEHSFIVNELKQKDCGQIHVQSN